MLLLKLVTCDIYITFTTFVFQPVKVNGNANVTPYVIPYVHMDSQPLFTETPFEVMRVNQPTLLDYVKKQM